MLRLFCALVLCAGMVHAADKPVPVAEAAGKMKLPPGFKVTCFAGEPDVVQPIAFTFDDRGRMWVVECLMYPKWSQDGKGGKDRVVILEDTDGDGKTDKRTVVLDGGVNLSGIELGFGGMYLCSSPNLIFIPLDGDKAGKPEILLDGWNIKDAKHNVFNSLVWGPDGWLYGCNGIQTKSRVGKPGTADKDRILFDCGVWKFHPTRKVFEVVATGTTNPWGLDFDEHGEMFITNCVIDHLWHIVPGGRYTRMYGQDYNPHTYGYMGSAVDYKHWGGGHWTDSRADKAGALQKVHDDAGGGHAHSGAAIYLGENFPKEYRNTLFTANIHGNRLNNDGLERTKSGMKGVRRPDFMFANDPWFRGICVKQGPNGELFTSDWCDTGECHNYDVADTTNGRIYRITYGDVKPWTKDVSKFTDEELVNAVTSQNEWLSRKARRLLQERAGNSLRSDKYIQDIVQKLMIRTDVSHDRIRYLWTLVACGNLDRNQVLENIFSKHPEVQFWSLKNINAFTRETRGFNLLRADKSLSKDLQGNPNLPEHLVSSMLSGLIVSANSLGLYADVDRVVKNYDNVFSLLLESPLNKDQLMLSWYVIDKRKYQFSFLIQNNNQHSLLYELLTRKRLATEPDPNKELDTILENFPVIPNDECRVAVLQGIAESLKETRVLKPSDMWRAVYAKYQDSKNVALKQQLDDVGLLFGDPVVLEMMLARVKDVKQPLEERARLMTSLASRKTANFVPLLQTAVQVPGLRSAALRGLANYDDTKTPAVILGVYAKLTGEEKADAVVTLCSRASYAKALLDAIEAGTVPKADLGAYNARQISTLKDKSLTDKLTKVWGELNTGTAAGKASIDKYKKLLNADYLAAGDAAKGKALFTKSCATCHKLHGEGQAVGPELTGSQRGNLDYVLENVCTPNAVVPFDYKMTQFYMKDGSSVAGLVKKESKDSVTVRTVNAEVVISVKDIDERKSTNLSIMPEGLFDVMKTEEVRDLVKYLQSK
jgi:putative membrane-bound dehydrogenase-like protein